VAELAQRSGLPMPKVYVIPSDAPNAFATGRSPKHAAVAATRGLLRLMDREQVRAVLAHELAHVGNRDTLIAAVAATIVGAISYLAQMAQFAALFGGRGSDEEGGANPLALLAVTLVAALGGTILQLAVSRAREFEADAHAARLLGTGEPLASALATLEMAARRLPMQASPATAHLFIVSPLAGGRGTAGVLAKLFRTHPLTEERIARLRDRSWAR
jgi:heat shock protein HtpX